MKKKKLGYRFMKWTRLKNVIFQNYQKNIFKKDTSLLIFKISWTLKHSKLYFVISYLVINGGNFFGAAMVTSGSVFFAVIFDLEVLLSLVDLQVFIYLRYQAI